MMDANSSLGRISRRRWATLPLLLAGLALLLVLGELASAAFPTDLPETIDFDRTVAATISQVTTSTLEYELAGLTGERPVTVAGSLYTITTRHTYQTEAISMATRYAYTQFAELDLVVTYHNYAWYYDPMRNVVAEKPGLVNPDEIYLITAHLDSRAEEWPHDPAPGADANGSGSVTWINTRSGVSAGWEYTASPPSPPPHPASNPATHSTVHTPFIILPPLPLLP